MPFLVGKENITCSDAVSQRAGPLLSTPVLCHNAIVPLYQSASGGLLSALRCSVCSASPGLRQDIRPQNRLVSPTIAPALHRTRSLGLSGLAHLSRRGGDVPPPWQPWCHACHCMVPPWPRMSHRR